MPQQAVETSSQNGNTPEIIDAPAVISDTPPISASLRGSSITVDEVDAVLRDGGNRDRSILRVAAYFMKDKTPAENADFLRREYVSRWRDTVASGKGFQFGNDKLAVWFGADGITLGRGDTAIYAADRVHVSWEQAAVRIRQLLDAGQYISGDLLDEAISNERRELAERLLHLYRDDFREFREMPEGWRSEKGGWPEDIKRVKEFLDDRGEYSEFSLILERLEEDVAALSSDPDAPKRFWHDPYRLLQDVRDCALASLSFPSGEVRGFSAMRFITEDEVDAYLTKGSNIEASKYRILSFFLHDHTPKEKAHLIKEEYGNGGGSHALGGADDSWYDGLRGKLKLMRGDLSEPYATVELSWSAAANRIGKLINKGRYMTRADLDRIPEYERRTLARQVTNFFYGVPSDERPYPSVNEFNHETDQGTVRSLLDDPEQVEAILAAMRPIMEATPADDRFYGLRRVGLDNLTALKNGIFTLFPGLNTLPPPETVTAPPRRRVEPEPEQLSLFSQEPAAILPATPQPVLRGVEEQRVRIEQAVQQTEREPEPPAAEIISRGEIDALLLGAVETTEQFDAILARFAENPRSREVVQLIKDVYSDGVYLMPRIDGAEGYMGLTGDAAGVTMSKSGPLTVPKEEREPSISIDLSWPKVHRRVAELVEAGQFVFQHTQEPEPAITPSVAQEKTVDISDAKIQEVLIWGIGYISKLVIFDQYGKNESPESNSDFLKGQYYKLHSTVTLSDGSTLYTRGDDRGFGISVQDPLIDDVLLEWPEVERRVAGLIAAGHYLTPSEKAMLTRRTKNTQEQAAITPEIYYSDRKNIPYREGDSVDALSASGIHTRMVLDSIDEDFIYYTMPDDVPEQEPVSMFRSRFEEYLDDGRFTIMESGTRLPSQAIIEPDATVPITADSLIDEAVRTLSAEEYSDRAIAGMLLQDVQGTRIEPIDFFNRHQAGQYDETRAAKIRGILHRALEQDRRSLLALPKDQRMPTPFPVTSKAWDSAEPHHKIETPDGSRYLLLMRNKFAEYQPVVLDDENGCELRRYHFKTTDTPERTGFVLAYSAQEAGFLIPFDDYVITNYLAADLEHINDDLLDVLENGLLSQEHKQAITELIAVGNATNDELVNYLSLSFSREAETLTLETGETADFFTSPHDISIEIQDKYNSRRTFLWNDVAPILRALNARGWREAELAVEPETGPVPMEAASPEREEPAEPKGPEPVAARPYTTGDTVYISDTPYVIQSVRADTVILTLSPSQPHPFPVHRPESHEDLRQLLRQDSRNDHLFGHPAIQGAPFIRDIGGGFSILQTQQYDYTPAETEAAAASIDPDLRAVLMDDAFFTPEARGMIADTLSQGMLGHTAPSYYMALRYQAHGEINRPEGRARYQADTRGIFFTPNPDAVISNVSNPAHDNAAAIADTPGGKLFTWEAVSEAVLTLCEYQLDGFTLLEPEARLETPEPEQKPPARTEQDIIDEALREWNGDPESKQRVNDHMREHGRERDTAAFLRREYGDDMPAYPVPGAGDLPWPKVQRRIAQLIEQDAYLTPDEMAYAGREHDFGEPEPEAVPQPVEPVAIIEEQEPLQYEVGDTVFLEGDREFTIDGIGESSIHLQDITFQRSAGFPIFRDIDIADFERLARENPLNGHMLGNEEPVWRETGDGETTRVMFDLMPEPAETEAQPADPVEAPLPPAPNYRITDDNLGAGGPKTRFAANIAAIRTLKQIEDEGRQATRPEQEILARYVGWGGLDKAFDDGAESWQKEYAELKTLLTPDEYNKARASVLNSHYTPPVVVKAIYDAIGQMGFKRGNMLEPSCGIGHFFGMVPEEMKGAKLYGVELDDLSSRIAEKLYPNATIINRGFEKTNFPDSFFDVVVGNVPFGDYKVYDQDYNRHSFHVHDYFIAKSIDKVRAGGVVALITSNGVSGGTFDKRDSKARRYMAERCDLIGAIRLPDNAFKAAAGTDMTTDILFLQKREIPRALSVDTPDWVGTSVVHEHEHEYDTGEIRNNVLTLNNYYQDHPEMVLGNLEVESGPFGPQLSCKPKEGELLADQLREAVSRLQADITVEEPSLDDLADSAAEGIPADPNVKNFSYTLVDNRVFYRENSLMYPVELPATTLDRIRGMVELRDCVHTLIDYQLNEYDDFTIQKQQQRLGELYDAFVAEYGLINSVANSRAFSGDSAYYLLCSLEILDENGDLERKADMFTKRTIKQHSVITSVDTASEALAVSIGERARVDLDFMSELSGLSKEKLSEDLVGVIFRLPEPVDEGGNPRYVTADEYLSGNIREKLARARQAAEVADIFIPNVEALEQAMPKDLEASEISVRLGSTWIDKSYYQQFMYELLQSSSNIRNAVKVNYSAYTGEWQVSGKARIPYNNIAAHVTYGTGRINAYEIIEDTLNLRDVRIYDIKMEDGKEKRILNRKETTLAQQKQEQIKQAFKDWVWKDPQRRQRLVRQYNDLFNSNRVREYDGSHIVFSGMNPEYTLRGYQANAIARILYGGNTLLAHEVGAGKTFEMVAATMEGKRLGLCSKSMFAVPNHIIDQIASDFLRLYPSANILVAQKKDFEKRNRKKFCAKIATGDYDAVIIGHSQLEKIPISVERQERLLEEQLWEVLEGIEEAKRSGGERFTVKQLERTKKRLELRLEKIREGKKRDDVVTFEQLGVDRLFVDEAHNYKNLFLYTKMRNVAGLSTTEAQKSNDLFLKCRYMDELTGGKGIIFATGTPVSNSMTELYTMQRYLQYENLQRKNLIHFDSWASIFGETITAMELAPEGTGYRARTRFSRFHNLPELMGMFCEIADIKTADTLDLVRPDAHFETVVVQPSELQQEMVQALSERAAEVHTGRVDPRDDNMLKITSDGRKIGLDQRLIDPLLPDFEGSKVNACLEGIHKVWADTKADRLTQLVFCDFSTPNKDGRFNVYDDIKQKLLDKGVPENEVAFIHDANTDAKKKELFAKTRKGQVRVLFGSTFKLGAGTNVQDRLVAMHDLDCPWRPADLEQRAGRIVRFGNQNPDVYIYRYVTEGTFDAYLWQTVENKQRFISQIMTSKSPVRSCEDVDETALSYAEIKALCSGNPLIKEKIDLDIEVSRLRLLKSEHQSQHHRLEDDLLDNFPKSIKAAQENIAGLERDTARLAANMPKEPPAPAGPVAEEGGAGDHEANPQAVKAPFPPMTVMGTVYTEKETAGKALLEACKSVRDIDPVPVGSYLGFDLSMSFNAVVKKYRLTLKGNMSYTVDMGVDPFGNITRLNNELKVEMPLRLQSNRSNLENLYQQMEDAKKELAKPFEMERALAEKEMRLALVNAELNIEDGPAPLEAAAMCEAESAKQKPSILDGLRARHETGLSKPRQDKTAGTKIMR